MSEGCSESASLLVHLVKVHPDAEPMLTACPMEFSSVLQKRRRYAQSLVTLKLAYFYFSPLHYVHTANAAFVASLQWNVAGLRRIIICPIYAVNTLSFMSDEKATSLADFIFLERYCTWTVCATGLRKFLGFCFHSLDFRCF